MRDYDRQGKNRINFQDFHEIGSTRSFFRFVSFFFELLDLAAEMILQRDSRDEILKAFKLFDDDESGKISLKKLRRIARWEKKTSTKKKKTGEFAFFRELGDNANEEELKAMIDEFDLDGDGESNEEKKDFDVRTFFDGRFFSSVNFDEFMAMLNAD